MLIYFVEKEHSTHYTFISIHFPFFRLILVSDLFPVHYNLYISPQSLINLGLIQIKELNEDINNIFIGIMTF